jgi:hypothetical protein
MQFQLCDLIGCYGNSGLSVATFLQTLLAGVPNMPTISITGGLLGGGQVGQGSVDVSQLMVLIRAYFGNPNLQPEYVGNLWF